MQLIWLLFAAPALAAATANKEVIMVALDNDTSLRFSACHNSPDAVTLLAAPTLGDGAFSVAWQPMSRAVLFSQPQFGKVQACQLPAKLRSPVTDLRLSTLVSSFGRQVQVKVALHHADGGSQGDGACRFQTSALSAADSADVGAAASGAASDHLLALTSFDGCVTDEANGGGRHCFGSWSGDACRSDSPGPAILSRAKRATCSPADCKNGGVCNNITASPVCVCPLPFIAPNCTAFSSYCTQTQPDLNITSLPVCISGTCAGVILVPPYFNCSCTPGFEGVRCDREIDECAAKPCVNGLCQDLLNNYSCSCYRGWEGRNCSANTDDCTPGVCSVRDRCVDGNSTCSCAAGWLGVNCSAADFCARGSCPNGTVCVNLSPQTFECRAAATFAYNQASPSPSPSPTAWRLSPSGGLAEPLTATSGWVRTRQANSNSTVAVPILTAANGDRQLAVALTPTGRLAVSLDNQTATTSSLSIATGEFFRFNLTAQPGTPLALTVVALGNNSTAWFAQSAGNLPNASLTLDSAAIVTLGDGFKGCLDDVRLNGRLLPMANWSLPAGVPGFVRFVDWPANQSSPAAPRIGCYGDPVCDLDPRPACLNSGRCLDLWNSRACACPSGYAGPACGSADCGVVPCAAAVAGVSTPVVVTLCVLALVVVVVIIAAVLVKLARARRSETGQYRPSKEESNHGNKTGTLSVLRPPVEERLI